MNNSLWSWLFTPASGDFLLGFLLLGLCIVGCYTQSIWLSLGPKNRYFKKSIGKKPRVAWGLSAAGIVLVLLRFGDIALFRMPIWLSLWGVAAVAGMGTIKYKLWKEYQKRIASARREGVEL